MKKKSKRQLIKKLDILFSKIVREGKGCLRCGKKTNLHCAHIFSRRYMTTRWNLDNAIPLCYACHIFWCHRNPIEFTIFVTKILGEEKLEELRKLSLEKSAYTVQDLEQLLRVLEAHKPEPLCL